MHVGLKDLSLLSEVALLMESPFEFEVLMDALQIFFDRVNQIADSDHIVRMRDIKDLTQKIMIRKSCLLRLGMK